MITTLENPSAATAEQRHPVPTVHADEGDFPDRLWITIRDVPIFVEHETTTMKGRYLRFGRRELQVVCSNCNKRIRETGDFAGICIGHTAETGCAAGEQLPLVGLAGPFRVAQSGNKWAILADLHIRREHANVIREYPRRSAELWIADDYADMYLDPVALLGAEAPRLDMGLLYSAVKHRGGRAREVERYAMTADQVRQYVHAIEQLDWVAWVKSQMDSTKTPGSLPDAPNESALCSPAGAYEESRLQFCKIRDRSRELQRYGRTSDLDAGLVTAHRGLQTAYQDLQNRYRPEIEAATKAASRRASRGEAADFECELRRRGVPKIAPPPGLAVV